MSRLPDGRITKFAYTEFGELATVEQQELVYCMNCKNARPSVNWCGEVQENEVHCNYGLGSLRKLNDFCSSGERREEDFENQKI